MSLAQCLLDVELVADSNPFSFSAEYLNDGKLSKFNLFLPFCVIQLTTRWES
jgi:hypothetical protein